jgi:hypothetical protein
VSSLKTYILDRSTDELKIITQDVCKKILSALKDAYPEGLTTRELVEKTGEAESTVYSYRRDLERSNFIKELKGKRSKPGRPSQQADNTRSSRYIVENANYLNYSKDRYHLAPGNVEYTTEFLRTCNRLLNEINLSELNDLLLSLVKRIHRLIRESSDEGIKQCAPTASVSCPNCNINHEARDFVRAVLLRVVYKFETFEGYLRFLADNEYISRDYFQVYQTEAIEPTVQSIEPTVQSELEPNTKQMALGTTVLRLLTFEKNVSKDQIQFLAINQDKRFLYGTMDTNLKTHDMTSDAMVECLTNDIYDTDDGIYISLSEQTNDFIRVISDDPSFPKVRELVSSIESVLSDERKQEYFVKGVIIQELEQNTIPDTKFGTNSGTNSDTNSDTMVLLRDNSGIITLFLDELESKKCGKGDKILVLGAHRYDWKSLKRGTYGSIVKIETIHLADHQAAFPNDVYFKHLVVNKYTIQNDIMVVLETIDITPGYTHVFFIIDNWGEKEISVDSSESIAIQDRRQYIGEKLHGYKHLHMSIPPGIEESGVISFPWLRGSEPMVSFRVRMRVGSSETRLHIYNPDTPLTLSGHTPHMTHQF